MKTYEEFKARLLNCKECGLFKTATQSVNGDGPIPCKVMLIGEAPGRDEDVMGKPFVGAAGKVLTKCLNLAGINRTQVYITNVVKHRPPNNRVPNKIEVESCAKFLDWEIEHVNPKNNCLFR